MKERVVRWNSWLGCLCFLLCLGGPASSMAQQTEPTAFHVQQFRPSGDPNGLFQTHSGQTLGQWRFSGSLMLHYSWEPLFLISGTTGREQGVVEHQVGADLTLGFGILSWLDIGAVFPMSLYQVGSLPKLVDSLGTASGRDLTGFFLSDFRVRVKLQLLNQKSQVVNLALLPYVGLPTGDPKTFNGEGGVSGGGSLLVGRTIELGERSLKLGLNVGFRYQPETKFLGLLVGSELFYSVGMGVDVLPRFLTLVGDIGGSVGFAGGTSAENSPMGAYLGARIFPTGNKVLAVNAGFGLGLLGGYGSPRLRFFLGLTVTPGGGASAGKKIDSDGDGLTDDVDRCPNAFGPHDNKGCPHVDTDGDGVPDREDKCPKQRGTANNQGCPIQDADNDGVPDDKDNCPRKAGSISNAGCPVKTGGRVEPPLRRFPVRRRPVKNRTIGGTGFAPGRSARDRDGDGVPNRRDRCPDIPGSKRRRGCPRRVYVKLSLRRRRIYLKKPIVFWKGTRMTKRSKLILWQLGQLMMSRLKLRIRILATSYSRSRKRWVSRLSRRRARAIRTYLVKEGVELKRIQFRGYRKRGRKRKTKTTFKFIVLR